MRIKSATEENDIISKSDSKRRKGLRLSLPKDLEISSANHVFLSESSYQNLRNEDKNQKKVHQPSHTFVLSSYIINNDKNKV
jgi:hypothetical protein